MSLLFPEMGILRRMGWVLLIGGLLWGMGMAQSRISYSLQGQTLIAKQEEQVLWRTRVSLDNPVLDARPEGTVRVFSYDPDFTLLVFDWKSKRLVWKYIAGKLPVVDPSYELESEVGDKDGILPVSLVARGKQLYLSTGTLLWQAPYNIALHPPFSYKTERFLVVGVSQYMHTLPFVAYDPTSGVEVARGNAQPSSLIKSGYAQLVRSTQILIAQGQHLKLFDYRKGVVVQTKLPFRATELQESGGYFFAYRQNNHMDNVEPDTGLVNLTMLNIKLKLVWQSSESNMNISRFTANQNTVIQQIDGGNPIRSWVLGRDKRTGKELWSFRGDLVKSLPGGIIIEEEAFPMHDTNALPLAAKPIFVIVNPKNGRYRKLSFTIPNRPNCSFVDFPITDGGYNYVSSYDADEGHIYITRQDLCGRFISTFPWR